MAFLAGLIPALLGGITGASNTRPPSLDPTQRGSLDQLLQQLMGQVGGAPTIDPVQQALMYGNIAASRTGADTAVTHALSSRGLGTSGLLGAGLIQNQNVATQSQNAANLGLQQQAVQQRQMNIQDILGLLNVNNTPGQSGFGGFMAGLAPILAYSIQHMANNGSPGGRSSGGGGDSGGAGGGSCCWVATELYGSRTAPETVAIFDWLNRTPKMKPFLDIYERIGPSWAEAIRGNTEFRRETKKLFDSFLMEATYAG